MIEFKDSRNILVIGDWFVDENWIVTTENSPTSSHIGKQQYRSRVGNIDAQLLSLCGAGSVARLLHSLDGIKSEDGKEKQDVQLFGLGHWEPDDTHHLAALFRSDCQVNYQTPHTLRGMIEVNSDDEVETKPLCHKDRHCFDQCAKSKQEDMYKCERLFSLSEKGWGTWRVLRVYGQTGAKTPVLMHRYDWELLEKKQTPMEKSGENVEKLNTLFKLWKKQFVKGDTFDAIVIVDHDKGVVSTGLIKFLKNHPITKGTRWYARTKNPEAEWLTILGGELKLLLFGPMYLNTVFIRDPWFYGKHLSLEAIEWLRKKAKPEKKVLEKNFNENINTKESCVIAFHKDGRIAAYIPSDLFEWNDNIEDDLLPKDDILLSTTKHPDPRVFLVGRTSVFFAYMVSLMENLIKKESNLKLSKQNFLNSMEKSYDWCRMNEKSLYQEVFKKKTKLDFRENFRKIFTKKTEIIHFNIALHSYKKEVELWEKSHSIRNYGIIDQSTENLSPVNKFQIWRGWSPVDGFIALDLEHRKNIARMVYFVRDFVNDPHPRRSVAAFILGGPGWGKSFLVERLAKSMDMSFIEFNITHLAGIDDLLSCFDRISSMQTNQPEKPFLIFWDEINAHLNRDSVYSYFLAPLWDGVYRRAGQTFHLRPCIWIFAGTRLPGQEDNYNIKNKTKKNNGSNEKGSDFLSRINGPKITLKDYKNNKHKSSSKYYTIERLYTAISILRRHFPELLIISKNIMEFFINIDPKYGTRSLEFIISKFKNVSHGKLDASNLPDPEDINEWLNKNINKKFITDLRKRDEKFISYDDKYVRLYDQPPK